MYNNIYKYEIPREVHNLTFSVWNKNGHRGHALFVGNHVQIFHFLKINNIKKLEVSTLDLNYMESYDSLPAEEWLKWYYSFTSSLLEEDFFIAAAVIRQSIRSIELNDFSEPVIIGIN